MEFSNEKYIGVGNVPIGIGAQLKGWAIEEEKFRSPDNLPVVDFLAMTHACPHDCYFCFTCKIGKNISIDEIKRTIDQLAEAKAHAVNFVGEGEPTIDKDFFEILEYTASKNIQPVIFTDAATKLRDRDFVRRMRKTGASVAPKCDSLFNPIYQNWLVQSKRLGPFGNLTDAQREVLKNDEFFHQRNEAIQILMEEGFNEISPDGTTRMGFDMVITKANLHEVERTLRFCRDNNLWIVFAFFIPAGRSACADFDQSLTVSEEEKQTVRKLVQQTDRDDYGFEHDVYTNFITMPCVEFMQIRGNGDITPCPGNPTVIGNIRESTIRDAQKIMMERFPCHNPMVFDGKCLYR